MKFTSSLFIVIALAYGCTGVKKNIAKKTPNTLVKNALNYNGTAKSSKDRDALVFSDQGAWFGYSMPLEKDLLGFSGPFLMTQENGVWISPSLSNLKLIDDKTKKAISFKNATKKSNSYNSHLEQVIQNSTLQVKQRLVYASAHSAIINTTITNTTDKAITFIASVTGDSSFLPTTTLEKTAQNKIKITTPKSSAKGFITFNAKQNATVTLEKNTYNYTLNSISLDAKQSTTINTTHTFIFPRYAIEQESKHLEKIVVDTLIRQRIAEKKAQIKKLQAKTTIWKKEPYTTLQSKAIATLQNNWRVAAGALHHDGVFPSYHYIWFHGFWAWDSWKHAAALAQYDTTLAKKQILAMYDYMEPNGFIPDCIYRDTSIEKHNYRNTKAPLSGWAIWQVYKNSKDISFLEKIYPKLIKQHQWWYTYRDHDKDGLCEYGSTDGSIVAAKWESGMDNAVRFDASTILKNTENAFSLNQESVDLNAYLYAEKQYLKRIAKVLKDTDAIARYTQEASVLKTKIQEQFFDDKTGWFYDTSLDGKTKITAMGCEGWIPLWAKAASTKQAEKVQKNMMDPTLFNTKVPLPTLSASDPKFSPNNGYWRGPNWLDQVYFGIKGLEHYQYTKQATELTYKTIHNAEGVLEKGISIRENYQPITGKGLEAKNFSWSAAHYLLLLINE